LAGLVGLLIGACSPPAAAPPPTSPPATARPVAAPTPSVAPRRTPDTTGADPAALENAFLSNIDDLVAEAADLSSAPCEDLTIVARDNPNMMRSLRGFAASLKRLGSSQAALDTEAVKAALADLDRSITQLDSALGVCGINSQP
jgi:hypothetical protein